MLNEIKAAHPNEEQFELISASENDVVFNWHEYHSFHISVHRNSDGTIVEITDTGTNDELTQNYESLDAYCASVKSLFA